MGLTAKDPGDGGERWVMPEGVWPAVCYALFDLGTQFNEVFGSKAHKCRIIWEVPEFRFEGTINGEEVNLPRVIGKSYTVSLHEKSNLRKDLETWRGRSFTAKELEGFDIRKLLGVSCMIQVLHKTKDKESYANVANIMPLAKGMDKLQPENDVQYFSFEDWEAGEIDGLPPNTPEWLEKIIMKSDEWKARSGNYHQADDSPMMDDDDPGFMPNGDEPPF